MSKLHTILVVEDEFLIRMMLSETLGDGGYDVREAATAEDALTQLQRDGTVSIMITDITLPGRMDGLELARAARGLHADMPIIFVSGRPDAVTREMLGPRDVVIGKPYLPSAIATAVRRVLGE